MNEGVRAEKGEEKRADISSIADDDSGAFFTQHTPLFRLGTPVPALFATEEAEHSGGFLSLGIFLYEGGTLVSHLSPRTGLVENYLYASAGADAALRASLAVVHRAGERGCGNFGAVVGEVVDVLAALRGG